MKTLFLLSCAKKKLETPSEARTFYRSGLFRLTRRYIESQLQPHDQWMILSAKHGLVAPLQVVEPYDLTLSEMGVGGRMIWTWLVFGQLTGSALLADVDRIVFFAGHYYQKGLRKLLSESERTQHIRLEDPLAGLFIGQRLRWLSTRTPKKQVQP